MRAVPYSPGKVRKPCLIPKVRCAGARLYLPPSHAWILPRVGITGGQYDTAQPLREAPRTDLPLCPPSRERSCHARASLPAGRRAPSPLDRPDQCRGRESVETAKTRCGGEEIKQPISGPATARGRACAGFAGRQARSPGRACDDQPKGVGCMIKHPFRICKRLQGEPNRHSRKKHGFFMPSAGRADQPRRRPRASLPSLPFQEASKGGRAGRGMGGGRGCWEGQQSGRRRGPPRALHEGETGFGGPAGCTIQLLPRPGVSRVDGQEACARRRGTADGAGSSGGRGEACSSDSRRIARPGCGMQAEKARAPLVDKTAAADKFVG